MKYYLLIFFIVSILSCQNKNEIETINQPRREIDLIYQDVSKGDTLSYLELRNVYLDNFSGDFLYWAIFMSNKYGYAKASFDVFEILVDTYVGEIEKINEMDKQTKEIAIEYLKKASMNGNIDANQILKQIQ